MEFFKKKNEIGLEIECGIIAKVKYGPYGYVLYTNYLMDKNNNLKIFVGRLENNKVIDVDKELEEVIIYEFNDSINEFYKNMKEGLQ